MHARYLSRRSIQVHYGLLHRQPRVEQRKEDAAREQRKSGIARWMLATILLMAPVVVAAWLVR